MSRGLTFEIMHIISRNFHGYWDSVQIGSKLKNALLVVLSKVVGQELIMLVCYQKKNICVMCSK